MKTAIITGITGQDGAYLAELLLNKGYAVHGTYRRTSSVNFWRIEELGIQNHPNLHLVEYDLTDLGASIALVQKVQPDEIYNLAAQSFVGVSFDQPTTTAQITGLDANPLTRAKIELGRQLYFDPRLSADSTVSCASCHNPALGFSDGRGRETIVVASGGGGVFPGPLNDELIAFRLP